PAQQQLHSELDGRRRSLRAAPGGDSRGSVLAAWRRRDIFGRVRYRRTPLAAPPPGRFRAECRRPTPADRRCSSRSGLSPGARASLAARLIASLGELTAGKAGLRPRSAACYGPPTKAGVEAGEDRDAPQARWLRARQRG